MIAVWLLSLACTDTGTSDTGDSGPSQTSTEPVLADCPVPDPAPVITEDWEALPLASAGDVIAFATSDADPDRVYAMSTVNGPFRSDDGGHTWTSMNAIITHVLAQPLASNDDPDLVFHSVGELYRSEDGGDSWQGTGIGDRQDNQRYIKGLAWVGSDLLAVDASGQVFRSTDQGLTFEEGEAIDATRHATYYEPDNNWWRLEAQGDTVLAARHRFGVWRSFDGGETWEDVSGMRQVEAASLGMDETRAWYADNDGFHFSEDGGATFVRHSHDGNRFVASAGQEDGSVLLFTEKAIWRYEGGTLNPWAVADLSNSQALSAHTLFDDTVLMGHEQGILRSQDGGLTWSASQDGLVDDDLAVLLAHDQCSDLVFVGTQCEGGAYLSTDAGNSLQMASIYMHYVMVARQDPHDPYSLWVTSDDRVNRSRDLGATWEIAVPDSLHVHFHGLDLDPHHPGTVLIGSVASGTFRDSRPRVYRTDDDGVRWKDSSEGLPDGEYSVHALHFARSTEDVVLMGSFRGGDIAHNGNPGIGMFRSTDGGRSWSAIPLDGVEDVAGFVECDGRIHAATTTGVLASDDAGQTWETTWASEHQTLAVACFGDTVLALDQLDGLVRSDDRGTSWTAWDQDLEAFKTLEDQYLAALAISADGGAAWAALRGEGLFRRGL